MKPVTGNQKVSRILAVPPDQRKGTVGYLVDRWHQMAREYQMLEAEVVRSDRVAAEARTQFTKAHGALEAIERMIGEHEEPTAQKGEPADGEPLPPPQPIRRRAEVEKALAEAEAARKAAAEGASAEQPGKSPGS